MADKIGTQFPLPHTTPTTIFDFMWIHGRLTFKYPGDATIKGPLESGVNTSSCIPASMANDASAPNRSALMVSGRGSGLAIVGFLKCSRLRFENGQQA